MGVVMGLQFVINESNRGEIKTQTLGLVYEKQFAPKCLKVIPVLGSLMVQKRKYLGHSRNPFDE